MNKYLVRVIVNNGQAFRAVPRTGSAEWQLWAGLGSYGWPTCLQEPTPFHGRP